MCWNGFVGVLMLTYHFCLHVLCLLESTCQQRSAWMRNFVARDLWFTGVFDLRQNGLEVPKPDFGINIESRGFVCLVVLHLNDFTVVTPVTLQNWTSVERDGGPKYKGATKKRKRLDSPSGEMARKRKGGHHMRCAASLAADFASSMICCKMSADM